MIDIFKHVVNKFGRADDDLCLGMIRCYCRAGQLGMNIPNNFILYTYFIIYVTFRPPIFYYCIFISAIR